VSLLSPLLSLLLLFTPTNSQSLFVPTKPSPLNLRLLTDFKDAACLDGSPGAYYVSTYAAGTSRSWLIFFEGGGWCYDGFDCLDRSKSHLGSSKGYGQVMGEAGGMLSTNCEVNPAFCSFNRVYMKYCDGNSFSGLRPDPLEVKGSSLHFSGRRILSAALEDLLKREPDFQTAEEVLLSGGSAGGLATFINADWVGTWLRDKVPSLKKYRAMPLSGFFPRIPNVHGIQSYENSIKGVFTMSKPDAEEDGLNRACVEAMDKETEKQGGESQRWKCNFAEHLWAFTKTPLFLVNSVFDNWVIACEILGGDGDAGCHSAPDWTQCGYNLENCSENQIFVLNEYRADIVKRLPDLRKVSSGPNGLFMHSCHTHVEAMNDDYLKGISIEGVSMREAILSWWNLEAPTAPSLHWPCALQGGRFPVQCNPTCAVQRRRPPTEAVELEADGDGRKSEICTLAEGGEEKSWESIVQTVAQTAFPAASKRVPLYSSSVSESHEQGTQTEPTLPEEAFEVLEYE